MSIRVVGGVTWFNDEMVRKVGNGLTTSFWKDIWVGSSSHRSAFPRLYSLSIQKEASIADIWSPEVCLGL